MRIFTIPYLIFIAFGKTEQERRERERFLLSCIQLILDPKSGLEGQSLSSRIHVMEERYAGLEDAIKSALEDVKYSVNPRGNSSGLAQLVDHEMGADRFEDIGDEDPYEDREGTYGG